MVKETAIPRAKPVYIDEETGAAVYPASPSQARMLFLHEFADGSPVYSSHHVFRITGPLNRDLLEESLRDLVGRHDGLRTIFQMEEDEMLQKVLPEIPFVLEFKDLLDLPPVKREDAARRLLTEAVHVPFDLSTGPLFRVMLVRLDQEEHAMLFLLHHIITDGWSMANLYKELTICYNDRLAGRPISLPDLPIQMTDYSVWLNGQIKSGAYDNQFAYWQEKLGNEPPPLDLRPDFPRSAGRTQEGRICVQDLDKDLVEQLGKFARTQSTTLFTVLAAAFKALIHQRTGESDLLVGIPVANRMRPEVEPIFGCLINTLVLRTDLSGNPSFESLVKRVRQTTLEAYSHQELPFDKLVERLKLKRYPGQSPLFQVHLNLQEFGSPKLNLEGTECSTWVLENETAKFDLSFAISRHPGGWRTRAEYRTDLFREETILDLLRQWKELLIRICAEPELPLASLFEEPGKSASPSVTVDTRFLDVPECIHVRFERQAAATPDARAVFAHGTSLTYGELNVRANRLAHYLRARGVGPDGVVGLCVKRSPEMIIGILGILKAGGAYLPLDPEAPALRNTAILADSGSQTVLTVAELSGQFDADGRLVVFLDDARLLEGESGENPVVNTNPENLVYILYTSGSTGEPKGVMVEHRNLDAYTKSVSRSIPLVRGEYGLLQPLTADTTQTLLASGLLNGSCLHLISRPCSLDASALVRYFTDNPVDVLKITPSHMAALLGIERTASLLPRKVLILGGETMPVALVNRIVRLSPACELWNHYGPTESTVGILTHKVDLGQEYGASESIPLGRPLAGVSISVTDESGKEVPSGQRGELVVSGKLVTRGYLNHPDKTAAVFSHDPSLPDRDGRRYRTGDLVRMLPDGSVEFHGRKDHQVKIRGYRVELGEIEAALASHPSVEGQVVVFRENAPGGPRLDAYVVDVQEGKQEAASIIDFLKERLPAAMIPSTVTFLEEIPRTPMGKVDRKALPVPELEATVSPADAERISDPVLRLVVESCADVLGMDLPDPEDNFFYIGGHSLTAMQMMNRIRNQVRADLPLQLIFDHPVLKDFAAAVQSGTGGKLELEDRHSTIPDTKPEGSGSPESRQDKASLNAGLHQLVEAQVRRTPDGAAIRYRGITTSFSELNGQANKMAYFLRESGVGENSCVAILMDRSAEMVVAMLAILKAGGAWLPLDPDYPPARLRFMLEDSGASFLVASRKYAGLSESSS
jgi:amino acid adenylation domain-containing protein